MEIESHSYRGCRRHPDHACADRSARLEKNKENTLKHISKTSGSRALLVLCAFGFLCANAGLAAAKDQTGQQTAKPKQPPQQPVLNIISGAPAGSADISTKRAPKQTTGKTEKK